MVVSIHRLCQRVKGHYPITLAGYKDVNLRAFVSCRPAASWSVLLLRNRSAMTISGTCFSRPRAMRIDRFVYWNNEDKGQTIRCSRYAGDTIPEMFHRPGAVRV